MFGQQSLFAHVKLFHPLLLNQANRQRRMGGEGQERRNGRGGGGGDGGRYSCPVMQGEVVGTVHCRCSSFSFLPSLIPRELKGVKTKGAVWFGANPKVNTFSLPTTSPLNL